MVHLVAAIALGAQEVGADAPAEAFAASGMFEPAVEDWAHMLGAAERGEGPPVDWGLLQQNADTVAQVQRASDEELVRAREVLVGLRMFYALYMLHGLLLPDTPAQATLRQRIDDLGMFLVLDHVIAISPSLMEQLAENPDITLRSREAAAHVRSRAAEDQRGCARGRATVCQRRPRRPPGVRARLLHAPSTQDVGLTSRTVAVAVGSPTGSPETDLLSHPLRLGGRDPGSECGLGPGQAGVESVGKSHGPLLFHLTQHPPDAVLEALQQRVASGRGGIGGEGEGVGLVQPWR
ncbi:hypothetical protein [Streptomyces sp. IBSBF 3136]|uniref:hypothetical protein n=1 Tax=Streptomyces sp. IBSBF 3136 TaxID=2903524 RepID=UPI002FDBECBC